MAINFPASPTIGQTFNSGYNTYTWDGRSWTTAGGGSGVTISIGDSKPTGVTANSLWWQSNTGMLKIYYTDADSSQWVDAIPVANTSTLVTTGKSIAMAIVFGG